MAHGKPRPSKDATNYLLFSVHKKLAKIKAEAKCAAFYAPCAVPTCDSIPQGAVVSVNEGRDKAHLPPAACTSRERACVSSLIEPNQLKGQVRDFPTHPPRLDDIRAIQIGSEKTGNGILSGGKGKTKKCTILIVLASFPGGMVHFFFFPSQRITPKSPLLRSLGQS